nr:neuronal acetylcholine receptor subunit alpha-10-like [Pocillopora verrucosa]
MAIAMARRKFPTFALFTIGLVLSSDVSFRGFFVEGAVNVSEKRLIQQIAKNINPNVRPVLNPSEAVNITLDITFHGVIEMAEKYQILTSSVWVRQRWINQLIRWNTSEYGGLEEISIDSSLLWKPDIVLYNNVFEEFGGRMDNAKTRIRVNSTGHCYWAAPFIFKTSCHFNVRDFPFDEQQCKLKFGSWNLHKGLLDLVPKRNLAPVAKEKVENGEWNVISIQIKRSEDEYACCPDEKYTDVTFYINLKRRSLFYTYNLIIPNFLIALLAFFSFYIPVECGERISFVITVLLSMTVFLLLVAESIPPTSEAVPVIGMYYTCSIIEVALALVATGISLKMYYSYLYGKGLSPRLRRFLFCRLAPLLWVDTEIVNEAKLAKNKSCFLFKCLKRPKSSVPRDSVISMYNVIENKANQPNGVATTAKNEANLLAVDAQTSAETDITLLETQKNLSDQEIRQRVKKTSTGPEPQHAVSSTLKGYKDIDFHATESRIAAAIVDRAFMVLFILVFFASTLIILLLPFIRKG